MVVDAALDESRPDSISLLEDSDSSSSTNGGANRINRMRSFSLPSLRISTHFQSGSFEESVDGLGLFQSPSYDRRFSSLSIQSLQSPSYDSPVVAFENYDFEFLIRWYRRVWSLVLGTAGLFDILAYLEPTLRRSYQETCENFAEPADYFGDGEPNPFMDIDANFNPEAFAFSFYFSEAQAPWYCSTWVTFLDRLKEYNVVIAFLFSWLWFMQSLSKAREAYYYKFSVREDKMELLSDEPGEEPPVKKGWTKRKQRKYNAQNAFYRRILSRMLLLPVGFYVISFHLCRGLTNGQWLYRELLIQPTANETVFTTIQDPIDYVTIEVSEAHAKMSTVFALFLYLKYHFLLVTSLARTEFLKNAIPKLRRKLVGDAVRNPRKLIKRVRKLLKYVRWIKYIIPLVVKLNKLRANYFATLRKRRQYRKSKKQQQRQSLIRRAALKAKSQAEREKDAAILIQRIWRSFQREKYFRVAVCFINDRRLSAAMKIQIAYRRMALQSRIKNSRKMRELFRLEQLKRIESKQMNKEDRRRLYQLQDEFLSESVKTINKRLLVRPNTRLAVLWNSIFVFCVLVEIAQNAAKPLLIIPKAKRVDGKKYRSMRLLMAESLTPIPVAETPVCKDLLKKPSAFQRIFFRRKDEELPTRQEVLSAFIEEISDPDYDLEDLGGFHNYTANHEMVDKPKIKWRCREPISTWRDGFRDVVALTFRPDPVTEWPVCQQPEVSLVGKIISPFRTKRDKPIPWFCSKPYSVVHDWYRTSWNFVIDQIWTVISIICFFDVFVKFFTGNIDPVTGELKPKPFFRRWIIPGLLLQLLVNPSIGSFSVGFFKIVDWIMMTGPVRVLRWCIAVLVPTVYGLRNLLFHALDSDPQLTWYKMMLWENAS